MSEQTITEEQQDLAKQVRQTKLNCIPILILVFLAISIVQGVINLVNTSIEEHRIYAHKYSRRAYFLIVMRLGMRVITPSNALKQKIDGTYSKYDKTKLRVGYSDVNTKDNHLRKKYQTTLLIHRSMLQKAMTKKK